MWKAIRENPRAVVYAVLMHLALLVLLLFSLDWTPKAIKPGTKQPIKAELVDSSTLKAVEKKKKIEQRKVVEEKQQQKQQRQAELEKQEKQRKVEAERKQKAEQVAKKKVEAERKQKAEQVVKKKAEAERKKKVEQKAEAERKKKAAQAAKKKAEAERKKKAEAARQREAEQALQAQLADEAAQARAQHALSEYIPYIQEKIQRNWLRPAGSPAGLTCLIQVKLIPGGEVINAQVIRSSGDPLFDRSVETAVLKASPLPLPEDPALFKYFREINFNFSPA